MKKKKFQIKLWMIPFTIFLILVIYLLVGFIFTILRSNAHYDYFVMGSYWQERCKVENNYESYIYGTPGARWCLIDGKFRTDAPSRSEWYFNFYFKNPPNYSGDFKTIFFLWPLHFVGIDMIHFKSIAGIWVLG